MKSNYLPQPLLLIFLVVAVGFSACVKDNCKKLHTYTLYIPQYKTKDEVRANIRSNAPRVIENTGKIYKYGQYIFLNELDKGIHVIDNSNPASPVNTAFINIPGNVDMAVKNGILYADLYTDLVSINISDPENVSVEKVIQGVFPGRYWTNGFVGNNTDMIITDWIKRDTTIEINCTNQSFTLEFASDVFVSSATGLNSTPVGTGGSMARFTLINDRLYTVGHNHMAVFNVSTPASPVHTNDLTLPVGIETIYPFKSKLFIGSNMGMYIYNINNPDAPALDGEFQHVRSCDPVIADDEFAYVTLRSGSQCLGFTNQLEVVRLNNFVSPTLVKTYPLFNPHGLSLSGRTLFICDGSAGLKIFDATDVNNLQLIKTIENTYAFDVITQNNVALVVGADGLYQYDYSNLSDIRLLSKISIN